MFETRPWDLGERQLFQLQEKLNAYVSFILDGEMKENFPHLLGKSVRIELRTSHEPSKRALGFLGRARDQLALQQISLEVVVIGEVSVAQGNEGGCCGGTSSGGGGCCGGGSSDHHHEEPAQESQGTLGSCGCSH
jgi:hypothetical protein